jgi:hypothetical protein
VARVEVVAEDATRCAGVDGLIGQDLPHGLITGGRGAGDPAVTFGEASSTSHRRSRQ